MLACWLACLLNDSLPLLVATLALLCSCRDLQAAALLLLARSSRRCQRVGTEWTAKWLPRLFLEVSSRATLACTSDDSLSVLRCVFEICFGSVLPPCMIRIRLVFRRAASTQSSERSTQAGPVGLASPSHEPMPPRGGRCSKALLLSPSSVYELPSTHNAAAVSQCTRNLTCENSTPIDFRLVYEYEIWYTR